MIALLEELEVVVEVAFVDMEDVSVDVECEVEA